ncbi:MAG: sensor histidine kinase [Gemmatimonadota bacterium]
MSTSRPCNFDRRGYRSLWLLVFGAWTVFGLVNGTVWGMATAERGLAFKWTYPSALAVAWAWAAVTPVIFAATGVWRPSRVGWTVSVLSHATLAVSCAACATWLRSRAIHHFSGLSADPFLISFIYWIDVWLFVYITLVVIGRALELRRRYTSRTLRADRLEAQLARAQLQYLESQLQPHFLFNALNTIQELAHETPRAAERMLDRLRALLRMSLERYGQDEVPLAEELAGLEPYIDIQRTRFSEWLTVVVDVSTGLERAVVPRFILQPIVENAIRHGLAVRQGPGRVVVSASRVGERLRLRVRDDGVGVGAATGAGAGGTRVSSGRGASTGIGLRNVSERLRQLYGADQSFGIRSHEDGGTEVTLELPWREGSAEPEPVHAAPEDTATESSLWVTGEHNAAMVTEPAPVEVLRAGTDSPRLSARAWLGIAGIWTLLAVFWTNQMVVFSSRWFVDRDFTLWSLARLQIATSIIWLGLSFPVLWAARRFRLTPTNWIVRLPAHILAALACGFVHLETMYRLGISSIPSLSYTNLNPITGDFFIYFALLAWSHSRDFVAWYRARDLEATRLTAEVARSRFQALRVQLRPEFLDATLAHLSNLVHSDVDRAERLITRLADALRLTLELGRSATASVAQELELVAASVDSHRLGLWPTLRLRKVVNNEVLSDEVPSRLVCTVVDELLANVPGSGRDPLTVELEADRVGGATRIVISAAAITPRGRLESHLWWRSSGVAARAVNTADSEVTVLFPDASSVMLMLGGATAHADQDAPYEIAGATS